MVADCYFSEPLWLIVTVILLSHRVAVFYEFYKSLWQLVCKLIVSMPIASMLGT